MHEWKHGDKSAIARKVKVNRSYISDLTKGHKQAGPKLAVKLEEACIELGLSATRYDWMYSDTTRNPLFGENNDAD